MSFRLGLCFLLCPLSRARGPASITIGGTAPTVAEVLPGVWPRQQTPGPAGGGPSSPGSLPSEQAAEEGWAVSRPRPLSPAPQASHRSPRRCDPMKW